MAISNISRSVAKKLLAVETPEGAGALVRRSIGSEGLRNLSPFLLLDHFHVAQGAGFPDHPHRGQATVTYMLEGASRHEDSAGHKGTIEQGGVQYMVAGKAYHELGPEEIPTAYPQGQDGPVKIKVINGKSHGVESPAKPVGGCWYFHGIFNRKATIFQEIPEGWTSFIYILKGNLKVGSDETQQERFYNLVLSAKENETGVSVEATDDNTEFILVCFDSDVGCKQVVDNHQVAGAPLDQTVVQYGPFVMTTREEIQKTLLDYRMGLNGFEKAHTWKSIIGN
ncbi:hypothetical protein HWV62_17589 [Athelia sp. TMB]|nr:hypothetical protein HWV62_17589 [Athelia sp. TMB]